MRADHLSSYGYQHLGRLLSGLDEMVIADDPLVVTSDHDELMSEHIGFFDHAALYEGNVAVPLIARGPGVERGHRIASMAHHTDLGPTLLETFGRPIHGAMQETSVWPAMRAECWSSCDTVYLTEATWQAK